MSGFLPPFSIPPLSDHTHTLILLHDRGSSGQNFGLDLLAATDSSGKWLQTLLPSTKLIFPNANQHCVTSIQGGPKMPQWLDNFSTTDPTKREALQFKGLREGSHHIHDIINAESIPLENIVVGGFGQGAAMALYAFLTHRTDSGTSHLGGCVSMSGWLPLRTALDGLVAYATDNNREEHGTFDINHQVSTLLRNQIGLPPATSPPPKYGDMSIIFLHGEADGEVPIDLAKQAVQSLESLSLNVTVKSYQGLDHAWRSGDEIDDIAAFLAARQY